MKQNTLETMVGFIVLLIAATFFTFVYKNSNYSSRTSGYDVIAKFQNIDGIVKGAEIKLAGIKIGYVSEIDLEQETYDASVKLRINDNVSIPKDSNAIVSTNGILGGKYIRINPGASDDMLKAEGRIIFTQSALNIEDLISKLMYSLTSKSQ